jgi:hypothetical protein
MTADLITLVAVVALVLLAAGMLATVMRCLTLLSRERERTETERIAGGLWADYAAGLEQWIAAQDPSLDEHFSQTPADTRPMPTLNGYVHHVDADAT